MFDAFLGNMQKISTQAQYNWIHIIQFIVRTILADHFWKNILFNIENQRTWRGQYNSKMANILSLNENSM